MKEIFIAAHEELMAEYMDRHPDANFHEAYENTINAIDDRFREKLADMMDAARQRAKDGGFK